MAPPPLNTPRRAQVLGAVWVLGVHGVLGLGLWHSLRGPSPPLPAPAARVSLWLLASRTVEPVGPVERTASAHAKASPRRAETHDRPAFTVLAPRPESPPEGARPGSEDPAAGVGASASSPAAGLNLTPSVSGPFLRRLAPSRDASPRDLALRDPRANTPRLSATERLSAALRGACFVDEVDAEGVVHRFPGRWVEHPTAGQSITAGVANAIGVGGKAPPVTALRCERAP